MTIWTNTDRRKKTFLKVFIFWLDAASVGGNFVRTRFLYFSFIHKVNINTEVSSYGSII